MMARLRQLQREDLNQQHPSRDEYAALPRTPLIFLLDGSTKDLNVGSVVRVADGVRGERVFVQGKPRRLEHAAMGTERWVPVHFIPDSLRLVQHLRAKGYSIVAVERTISSVPVHAYPWRFPLCLVLGHERMGVSEAVLEVADGAVDIPMLGLGRCLNVASAGAVAAYFALVLGGRV